MCSQCHSWGNGASEQWKGTAHSSAWATLQSSGHAAPSCEPCHTVNQDDTPGNSGYDEVPTEQFQNVQCESCHGPGSEHASGSAASPPVDPMTALDVQTCGVCHDSHSADNPGQVRTVAAVDLIGGQTADTGGAGQLCMQCHHARHGAEEQVPEGDEHFGPHDSNQADAVFGTSGNEGVNPYKIFNSSGHDKIQGTCVRCHVYATPYDEVTQTANVGHQFRARTDACTDCHGEIYSFDQIMAKVDYDNDGTIEGLQNEVEGLQYLLAETMVNWDNANNGGTYLGNPNPADNNFITIVEDSVSATAGDVSDAAVKLRTGGWNLIYESNERSHGVHNPAYIVQLLQQSILYYDPTALPSDAVLRDGRTTTLPIVAFSASE